jgi:hypothetical protein
VSQPTSTAALMSTTMPQAFCVLMRCALQVKGYPTLKVFHKGEEVKAYR